MRCLLDCLLDCERLVRFSVRFLIVTIVCSTATYIFGMWKSLRSYFGSLNAKGGVYGFGFSIQNIPCVRSGHSFSFVIVVWFISFFTFSNCLFLALVDRFALVVGCRKCHGVFIHSRKRESSHVRTLNQRCKMIEEDLLC